MVMEKSLFNWSIEQERDNDIDNDLIVVINSIATACKTISSLVAEAPLKGNTGSAGGATNQSGDEQKVCRSAVCTADGILVLEFIICNFLCCPHLNFLRTWWAANDHFWI